MKKIKLTQNQFALVDNEDYEKVNQYKWHIGYNKKSRTFYALRSQYNKKEKRDITIRMHRFIVNAKKGEMVDHKKHNGLDNRKSNLRIVNNSQNQMNKRRHKNSTSKYKGVYRFNKNKWRALIACNKIKHHIGLFINEIEAAKAYNKKAIELFGEYAYLNKDV